MDGQIMTKTSSLETLVAHTESNMIELKNHLEKIIYVGKDYNKDISSSLIILLENEDPELLMLTTKAIAEMTKCDTSRSRYAQDEIVKSIFNNLRVDIASERIELVKQCFRALGNLCVDCDEGRKIILDNNVAILINAVKLNTDDDRRMEEIQQIFCKFAANFALGGVEFSQGLIHCGIQSLLTDLLQKELQKDDMCDDMVHTVLLVISIIVENSPEKQLEDDVIKAVLSVLRETTNMEISDTCMDILHMQVEHDYVKSLLAELGAVQMLMSRIAVLRRHSATGEMSADDDEIRTLIKRACDLIVHILTGDAAMHLLFNNGVGETYLALLQWLDSTDYDLLTTGLLAIGNFARCEDYCILMMQEKIYDRILILFETHHGLATQPPPRPATGAALARVQHAALSALRNVAVPPPNKRAVAAAGRAPRALTRALPAVADPNVAYKLMAALRMLVDGQEGVAKQLLQSADALAAAVRWARGAEHAGVAGEAPRLIAWAVKHARSPPHCRDVIKVDGCVALLVNMLVASHSLMQNEAILSLTLLALAARPDNGPDTQLEYRKQLIEAEVGKHVAVLVETNCAKMPLEEAENLLALLDTTVDGHGCASEYAAAKVPEALRKFTEARADLAPDLRTCLADIIATLDGSPMRGETQA